MCLQVLCCCETAALKQTESLIVPNHKRSDSFCPYFPCNDFNSVFFPLGSEWDFLTSAKSKGLTTECHVSDTRGLH